MRARAHQHLGARSTAARRWLLFFKVRNLTLCFWLLCLGASGSIALEQSNHRARQGNPYVVPVGLMQHCSQHLQARANIRGKLQLHLVFSISFLFSWSPFPSLLKVSCSLSLSLSLPLSLSFSISLSSFLPHCGFLLLGLCFAAFHSVPHSSVSLIARLHAPHPRQRRKELAP